MSSLFLIVYHKKSPAKEAGKMCLERVLTQLAIQPCSDTETAAAAVNLLKKVLKILVSAMMADACKNCVL